MINIKKQIEQVISGQDLTEQEAVDVMNAIMQGEVEEHQMAAFLSVLRMKGETVAEVTGFAKSMRAHGMAVEKPSTTAKVMDVVGTGGDEVGTFNISTTSCFVLGSLGITIGKHGNRSVSSKCGAADVLEALGMKIDLTKDESEKLLANEGMSFFFAPVYHSAMKYAGPVRKALGMRTVFNILGPLASPIRANYQIMGVYSANLVRPMAEVLKNLGVERGAVIYGNDGLDELTLTTTTQVCEIKNRELKEYTFDPKSYGFNYCPLDSLKGGDASVNKGITEAVLTGERGPKHDVVVLNSALALYLYEDLDFKEAIQKVENQLASGKAFEYMKKVIVASQNLA